MVCISNGKLKEKLLRLFDENSYIEQDLYKKHNIKRGLRNQDGTGVLVGATRVASVEGYKMVDGKKTPADGALLYRGIPIYDIVHGIEKDHRLGYEEIIFLLLFGQLPSQENLDGFKAIIGKNMVFPKFFLEDVILKIPSPNVMNLMQRVVLALYAFDKNPEDLSISNQMDQVMSIIGKMPLIMAYSYMSKLYHYDKASLVLHPPKEGAGIAENILHLIRFDSTYTKEEIELLDLCLIVHAEHGGGNNSAFATHVVSSTGTDIYSSISTAIGSLKGPKHGGANFMVEEMINDLKSNLDDWTKKDQVQSYIYDIINKRAFDNKGLVYGMGHAVYTRTDPRAELLKKKLKQILKGSEFEADLELLENVEEITRNYFLEEKDGREICANVDLYSGLVYRYLGISSDLYTPIFALARTAGWCAHRLEQIHDSKIIRPAYVNLVQDATYVDLKDRK